MQDLKQMLKPEVIRRMDVSGRGTRMKRGFIRRRLRRANPISFSDKVMEFLDKGNMLDTIFVDFKKALVTVSHEELISDARENRGLQKIYKGKKELH